MTGTDPKLAALADNGGPTFTRALMPGSPAVGAGDDNGCPGTDQRGVARPQGASCDIGAYESAPPTATTVAAPAITTTSATLLGQASNPDLKGATVSFDYGTSATYGQSTAPQPLGAQSSATPIEQAISGLTPNTAYHFRVVVTNAAGTSLGADKTFTTSATPSQPPVSNQFSIGRISTDRKGKVFLGITVPGAGKLSGKATTHVRNSKHRAVTVTYGTGSASPTRARTITLSIKPTGSSLKRLKGLRKLSVKVAVKFSPTGGTSRTTTVSLTVRFGERRP